jgi:acyl-coenzyme A thioesterase PaaI-like protein
MSKAAFQEQINGNHCWGCGGLNEHGLKIKSYWSGDEAVCTWQPQEYHCAAPKDILNGGIIATLMDCHSICTAIAAAYRKEGREIGTEPCIWYATGSLQVEYLKPTPIGEQLTILAKIKEITGRKTVLNCSLFARGEECARGEVVAVRIPPDWCGSSPQGATRI